ARRTLDVIDRADRLDPAVLDAVLHPYALDRFRVEWERAAWENAGRPAAEAEAKCRLLRWRLHSLLARLSGRLPHYYEALLARPDIASSRAALGAALARSGRLDEAAAQLTQAVAEQPFDRQAARLLFQALGDLPNPDARRRLARDCRLLSQAAPDLLPPEPWFADAPPAGDELASIVVLCHNELAYTRLCLESVLRHT